MDTLEQEKAEEDGELEITDLPMDEVSSSSVLLVALGSHFSPRSRAWRLTTAGGAIFFVLLVLLTNFPFIHGKALGGVTASTAAKRSPVVLTMATLKADYHPAPIPGISSLSGVPPYCVPGSVPQDFAPDYFGPGVGDSPVWVSGFAGPHATVHIQDTTWGYTQYGWSVPIFVVLELGYTGLVRLQGRNLGTGLPIQFRVTYKTDPSQRPATSVVLDPKHPSDQEEQWKEWVTIVYIPAAGCYDLVASWAGGQWRVLFAAGR